MKSKIKVFLHLIDKYLPGIAAIALIADVIFLKVSTDWISLPVYTSSQIIAAGGRIVEGIWEFNGNNFNKSWFLYIVLFSTFSFCFNLIVIPGLALYFLKELHSNPRNFNINYKLGFFGVMLCMGLYLSNIIFIFNSFPADTKLRNKIYIDSIRESLIYDLTARCCDLLQDAALIKSGTDTEKLRQSIDNMYNTQPCADKKYRSFNAPGIKYKFFYEPSFSDSSIKVFGMFELPGDSSNYMNVDGSKGKIQVSVDLPLGGYVFVDKDN